MKKSARSLFVRFVSLTVLLTTLLAISAQTALAEDFQFPGLSGTVTVYEDQYGVPTIKGESELDVAFVQGYIHARDRFFQMDYNRKLSQGRLGELLGQPAIPTDVQLRTLGLARAALASWQAADAETKGFMQAYANGVNTWLNNNPLPPEYMGLELTKVEPWTPYDSFSYAKLVAFGLSHDLDIDLTITLGTYQAYGDVIGFNGTALFFEDTHRSQPMDGRVSVPGFLGSIGGIGQVQADSSTESAGGSAKTAAVTAAEPMRVTEAMVELAQEIKNKWSGIPTLAASLTPRDKDKGSNEWAVSGEHTENGYPLVANDPHLALDTPATFHESNLVHDMGEDSYSVSGVMFPGMPGIIQGCNDWLCWGSTVHPMDVSDVFADEVLKNALTVPTHTVHSGNPEPLKHVYQSYFVNVVGDGEPDNLVRANLGIDAGGISYVSPRRNNGPILGFNGDLALINQYTGWGPTQETKFVREIDRARNVDEFKAALQYFDFGSQNWIYGDVEGNIGYFTSAEMPLRSDLASGTVDGMIPPFIIRDGTGALNHEWKPLEALQTAQAVPFEILPYNEMPQVVNPPWGYIANGNNDPIGTTLDNNPLNQLRPGGNGIYYLNPGYSDLRVGRIDRVLKELVESGNPVTLDDMMELQGNAQMLDAELLMPTLLGIMSQVPVPAGSPMEQALGVLATWDYSTPTGLTEGWDAGDDPVIASPPGDTEIRNSAAATVYALWRSMLVRNTIDATLEAVGLGAYKPGSSQALNAFAYHLLNYGSNGGVGASGLPFFSQGLGETVAFSLQQALELLASDEFAPAFANSTDVMDYRWGKLHRIVFEHPLGLDIPNLGGFADLGPNLPGLARQGGFQVVDASSHSVRGDGLNDFMFSGGPNRRFVGEMTPAGVYGYETIPGGQSGNPFSPAYGGQLPLWLSNNYHELALGEGDGMATAVSTTTFGPPGMPVSASEEENNND